jgi:hypothetical protein
MQLRMLRVEWALVLVYLLLLLVLRSLSWPKSYQQHRRVDADQKLEGVEVEARRQVDAVHHLHR